MRNGLAPSIHLSMMKVPNVTKKNVIALLSFSGPTAIRLLESCSSSFSQWWVTPVTPKDVRNHVHSHSS